MPVVREELGPSLPQVLAPHWQRLSGPRRWLAVAAAVGAVVVLVAARFVLRAEPLKPLVVDGPVAFNLVHRADVVARRPRPGELLRLQGTLPGAPGRTETFTVRPLTVPPSAGDISAAYLLLASRRLAELQAVDPGVTYRGEGKARINLVPGYQLTYQTRRGGRLVFGKLFFLVPDPAPGRPQPRRGVELRLLAPRSGQTPSAADVGADIVLAPPLRSFRFGTERP